MSTTSLTHLEAAAVLYAHHKKCADRVERSYRRLERLQAGTLPNWELQLLESLENRDRAEAGDLSDALLERAQESAAAASRAEAEATSLFSAVQGIRGGARYRAAYARAEELGAREYVGVVRRRRLRAALGTEPAEIGDLITYLDTLVGAR
jgi:hypothetical protein